jgi:hypothetical protein
VFCDNARLALTEMERLRVILKAKESGLERLQAALGVGEGVGEGVSRKRHRAEIDDGDQTSKRRETEERFRNNLARSEVPKIYTNTGKGKEPASSTAGFLGALPRGVAKANPKSRIDEFSQAGAEPKKRGPGRPRKSTAVELPPGSTSSSTGRKNSRRGPEPPKKFRPPNPFIVSSPTSSEDEN